MNRLLTIEFDSTDKKKTIGLVVGIVVFVLLTVAQDFLRANVNGSAFYFSESFMFSAFWWFFVPFLLAQYTLIRHIHTKPPGFQLLAVMVPLVIHLFAFPLLVWLLSNTFYYHTFSVQQTLQYTLAEHVYLLAFVYAAPVLVYPYFFNKTKADVNTFETAQENRANQLIHSFLVSEGGKKITIAIQEIAYFSAVPPYIGIHTAEKKYLYTATLKSIATRLPAQQFVRVHKSTIVNINRVGSYTSRLNGDYDLTLKNKSTLRVSRNFAAEFKERFKRSHHLTAE